MSLRFREAWRARQDRRARINFQLAQADAAERMAWVNATRIPQQPTDAQCERIEDMLAEPGEWEAS